MSDHKNGLVFEFRFPKSSIYGQTALTLHDFTNRHIAGGLKVLSQKILDHKVKWMEADFKTDLIVVLII